MGGEAQGATRSGRDPAALLGVRLADRLQVERLIGEGGMGVVYEALDERRGERVALKTLGKMDAACIYRLKKEFRAIADVFHPNLVRLHELFCDDGVWFFTMDRIEGVSFLDFVRPGAEIAYAPTLTSERPLTERSPAGEHEERTSEGPFDEARLRRALAQLTDGVRAIHAAGRLHLDLKPSNVLVTKEGHLTILDFGIAEPAARDATRSVEAAGTPAYMAPEQLDEGGAVAASDWYAVGTMIYEALTGSLPFGCSVGEVMAAKLTDRVPADPREMTASAPSDLAELAMALLAADAGERPDGDAVAALLGSEDSGPRSGPVRSARTSEMDVPFVGRHAELARLQAALDFVRHGGTRVVGIAGESGIGKSTLVARFLDRVRARRDAVVLTGRCYERESVPFKAFDAVVDALSRQAAAGASSSSRCLGQPMESRRTSRT